MKIILGRGKMMMNLMRKPFLMMMKEKLKNQDIERIQFFFFIDINIIIP